jgi:hypothetical protein
MAKEETPQPNNWLGAFFVGLDHREETSAALTRVSAA